MQKELLLIISDFEKNVIMKNVKERKQLERELGIHTLAWELKEKKKNYFVVRSGRYVKQ